MANPELCSATIAGRVGASSSKVSLRRQEMELSGRIVRVTHVVGKTGQWFSRERPAKQVSSAPVPVHTTVPIPGEPHNRLPLGFSLNGAHANSTAEYAG